MAHSHVTITYVWSGSLIAPTFNPSDVLTAGIYPDATVLLIDNTGELIGGRMTFSIREGKPSTGAMALASYIATSGQQFSVQSVFGETARAGLYLVIGNRDEIIPIVDPYSHVSAPSAPQVSAQVSRDAVTLSWGAGSAGTNNAVTGYDVQYSDSVDGASWGSWTNASGSPASGTSLTVLPPDAVGSYRKFRVRTRGSAGADWYSGWVESTNTLRRKWNAFAGWTDPTLVARSTKIRSVHLTQLQERINTIRAFYGLGHASFSVITPRATRIAWATHIQEIRAAIDGVTTSHEAWNVLYSGKPRIDNITQLRRIIDNM